jgi:hypothetical protein
MVMMMHTPTALPVGFADLEPFTDEWALDSHTARMRKRQSSDFADVKRFYEAVLPRAEAILTLLESRQVEELVDGELRLLFLMLMFAEVSPAVERFGQVKVPYGFDQLRFPVIAIANMTPAV